MVKLRWVQPRDLKEILFIERLSFPTPWTPFLFWNELKKKKSYFWVLEKDREIIGYICFWLILDEAHLVNLAVRPERRRQGWGSFMMKHFLQCLRRKGIRKAFLEVRVSNQAALRLYQKFGFVIDGCRKGYYADRKEDAYLMSLSLASDQS